MQNFKVSNIIAFTYPDDKRRFSLVDACCFVCWPLPSLYCFETIDGSRIIRVATLLQDWFFLPFLVPIFQFLCTSMKKYTIPIALVYSLVWSLSTRVHATKISQMKWFELHLDQSKSEFIFKSTFRFYQVMPDTL